jgi:predicted ATPase
MGRKIKIRKCNDRCASFTFDELFKIPMSSVDYLAIADSFFVLLVKDVPIFNSMDMREEARRFITFIDIIYDAKVSFFC